MLFFVTLPACIVKLDSPRLVDSSVHEVVPDLPTNVTIPSFPSSNSPPTMSQARSMKKKEKKIKIIKKKDRKYQVYPSDCRQSARLDLRISTRSGWFGP